MALVINLIPSRALAAPALCYNTPQLGAFVTAHGRLIYRRFEAHRDLQPLRVFTALIDHPEIEAAKVHEAVTDLKHVYADPLVDFNQTANQILPLLQNGQVAWIAPESYTPLTLDEDVHNGLTPKQRYFAVKARLLSAGVSSEDTEQMLLLLEGPLMHVYNSHPEIQGHVRVEGLEDVAIKTATSRQANFLFKDHWRQQITRSMALELKEGRVARGVEYARGPPVR